MDSTPLSLMPPNTWILDRLIIERDVSGLRVAQLAEAGHRISWLHKQVGGGPRNDATHFIWDKGTLTSKGAVHGGGAPSRPSLYDLSHNAWQIGPRLVHLQPHALSPPS